MGTVRLDGYGQSDLPRLISFLVVVAVTIGTWTLWLALMPQPAATVTVSAAPSDDPSVELLSMLDARDERIAELRDLNAEVLADNANLDRVVADQADEIADLEERLDDAEDALAAMTSTEPSDEVAVVAPPPPPPPPPAPAPAPADGNYYENVLEDGGDAPRDHLSGRCVINPTVGDTVCEDGYGSYVCRSSASHLCGASRFWYEDAHGCWHFWDGDLQCVVGI